MVLYIKATVTGYQCNYGLNKKATVIIKVSELGRKTLRYSFSEPNPNNHSEEIEFSNGLEEKLGNISMSTARASAIKGLKHQVNSLLDHEEEFLLVN